MLDWGQMRTALLVFIAGWLLASGPGAAGQLSAARPSDASANERLGKIKGTLLALKIPGTALQAQVSENTKTQVDMQRQISDLNAKMSLVLWVGAAVGVLLLGAAWKSLERKDQVASPPAPAHAAYTGFGQWEMEALARRLVEELRRDEEARQTLKSKPARVFLSSCSSLRSLHQLPYTCLLRCLFPPARLVSDSGLAGIGRVALDLGISGFLETNPLAGVGWFRENRICLN